MKKEQQPPSKKAQIIIGIVTIVLMILMLNWCARSCSSESIPEATVNMNVNWDSLSYDQKGQWINDWVEAYKNDYETYNVIHQSILNQFNYPETVKYDIRPKLANGYTTDADAGWWFISGTGTASNAFNVPIKFSYQVRMIITPQERKVDKVTIME